MFDHGKADSADQMRTTYKAIIKHVGNLYGTDLSSELRTKTKATIEKPVPPTPSAENHLPSTRKTRHTTQKCMPGGRWAADPS